VIEECALCGSQGQETHHIIFRSQAKYMKTIKVNLTPLCMECHRGTKGVHKNKRNDLKLKLQLQSKLFKMFTYEFFTKEDIELILNCNENEAAAIVKKLCLYIPLHQKEFRGYEKEQLIRRLLGGRLY